MIFYWIALGNPSGGQDLRGPFNTKIGRDSEQLRNSDFWSSSDITVIAFETEGKIKKNAEALALELLTQDGTSPSNMATVQPTTVSRGIAPAPIQQDISPVDVPEGTIDIPDISLGDLAQHERHELDASEMSVAQAVEAERAAAGFSTEPVDGEPLNTNAAFNSAIESSDSSIENIIDAEEDNKRAFQNEIDGQSLIADKESLLNTDEFNRRGAINRDIRESVEAANARVLEG